MRQIVLLIVLSPVLAINIHSTAYSGEDVNIFFNPGFKLGYQFGEQSGFIFGGEISIVVHIHAGGWYAGALVDFESCRRISKVHLGLEGGYRFAGLSAGPSFLGRDGEADLGFTITAYGGGLLIPFVSATFTRRFGNSYDVGSYLKIPIPVRGRVDPID